MYADPQWEFFLCCWCERGMSEINNQTKKADIQPNLKPEMRGVRRGRWEERRPLWDIFGGEVDEECLYLEMEVGNERRGSDVSSGRRGWILEVMGRGALNYTLQLWLGPWFPSDPDTHTNTQTHTALWQTDRGRTDEASRNLLEDNKEKRKKVKESSKKWSWESKGREEEQESAGRKR